MSENGKYRAVRRLRAGARQSRLNRSASCARNTATGPARPAREAPVVRITPPSGVPHVRVSLNLSALLDSRSILLHFTGEQKWARFDQALAAGPAKELPLRALLRQARVPVEVYWSP